MSKPGFSASRALALLALGLALALPPRALSADEVQRPDENSLFGASEAVPATPSAAPNAPAATAAGSRGSDTDQGGLSQGTLGTDDFANGTVKNDPLTIGGVVYQQLYMDEWVNQAPGSSALSMPLQMDLYLDARPNDRVRAYVDARLIYDPAENAEGGSTATTATAQYEQEIAGSSAASVSGTSNPAVVLDQAWVNFDIARAAFVTVGKQHVKWGTGHIWNPTDFLTVQKLNPLQPYDLRLGDTMVKVDAPVPGMDGTNLYAIVLMDNPQAASTLQQTGGAFRAETVLWGAELGVDAVTRANEYPDYGFDLSAPLGPIDVYVEDALLSGHASEYLYKGPPTGGTLSSVYDVAQLSGPLDQTVAGLSYDFPWRENRQATLGAEYFYNEQGLSEANAKLLPLLMYQGFYTPFYMGENYASIYLSAEGPDEGKKTSYNLSNIVNISDGSAVSRLDFTWLLLDYLTYGAWVAVHYGTPGGELNFALNTPAFSSPMIPAVDVPAKPVELGMSLRMSY